MITKSGFSQGFGKQAVLDYKSTKYFLSNILVFKILIAIKSSFVSISPGQCDKCQADLEKPYKLPCEEHYVGDCCIEDSLRKCPKCGTNFPDVFVWELATEALENR